MNRLGAWLILFTALMALAGAGLPDTPMLRMEGGMHSATIWRASADAAGRLLATASDDKTVRLWNLATGNPSHVLRLPSDEGSVGKALAVAVSPDGRLVVVGGFTGGAKQGEQLIYFFSARHGGLVAAVGEQPTAVNHLTFSPDGRFLAACYAQRRGLRVYRVDLDKARIELSGVDPDYGEGGSYWADWSRKPAGESGWRLATTSLDGLIRVYEIPEAEGSPSVERLEPVAKAESLADGQPFGCAFHPGGELLAVGDLKAPRVVVLRSGDLRLAFRPDLEGLVGGDLSKVAWSREGARLMAAGGYQLETKENPILVWDLGGQGSRSSWPAGRQTVMQLLSLDQDRVLVATSDPLWAVLDSRGAPVRSPDGKGNLGRRAMQADFSAAFQGRFHLSGDASRLEIGTVQGGLEPVALNLRDLGANPAEAAPAAGLMPPRPQAPGLQIELQAAVAKLNGEILQGERNELYRCVAVSSTGDRCVVGTSFFLRGYGKDGESLWPPRRMPGEVWAVNVSEDGRFVVAACGDGTIRWHRLSDGEPLLSISLHRARAENRWEWICWTPEGYYQSSPNGGELIGWQINRGPLELPGFSSANQLNRVFEDRKGIVLAGVVESARSAAEVVTGLVASGKMQRRPTLAEALKGVPRVYIEEADRLTNAVIDDLSLRVTVCAEPTDSNVAVDGSSLDLKVNGKGLDPSLAGQAWQAPHGVWKRTWDVPLAPGPNELRAVARSAIDTKSYPARVTVRCRGDQAERGDLWILGVGVNEYRNTSYALKYCVADVVELAAALAQRAPGVYRAPPRVRKLLDGQATPANVLAALDELALQAKPGDAVALIYAGHGALLHPADFSNEPEYHLVLPEVTQMSDRDDLQAHGLSFREVALAMRRIPAQRQVILLDACHSGAAGLDLRSSPRELALRSFQEGTGTWLLASSGANEASRGHEQYGHGLFSYAAIEAIGAAKAAGGDQLITILQLRSYVTKRVETLSRATFGAAQYPQFFGPDDADFVLGWSGE
jgi:WD40 repeat protein